MRHFQHLARQPSDETIMHSTNTNGIKNIPTPRRDLILTKEMLGPRKHEIKVKTTCYGLDPVDVTL